ncbi:MAG: pyridoxamine 5'-phosphate oxidase [Oligoflexia bacterium]|nr:pyridoxamine 5'-phosphate oxidase [Oligoflexia bacterium]
MKDLRKEYRLKALNDDGLPADPFTQFGIWFDEAVKAALIEPNAMMLATADASAVPSLRAVLLKSWSNAGFVFFTNYNSRKGRDLAANPRAALLFYWNELERQVRIEGQVSRTSRDVSKEYFSARPREAQLAALASAQSSPIASRSELEAKYSKAKLDCEGQPIDCPAHWGGYIVRPQRFEFWQGRESRLHDRIEFLAVGDRWNYRRLSP